jgi:hypothetical protein
VFPRFAAQGRRADFGFQAAFRPRASAMLDVV